MAAITLEAAQVRRRVDPAALPFAAVAAGEFHVWAVETVDEGIEPLTGAAGADAVFAEGSVHRRVEDRLRGYADRLRDFAASPDGGHTPAAAPHRA